MLKDEAQSEMIRVLSSEEFKNEQKQRENKMEKERERKLAKREALEEKIINKLSEKFGEEIIKKAFEAQAKGEGTWTEYILANCSKVQTSKIQESCFDETVSTVGLAKAAKLHGCSLSEELRQRKLKAKEQRKLYIKRAAEAQILAMIATSVDSHLITSKIETKEDNKSS